jgi:hypothetical protein
MHQPFRISVAILTFAAVLSLGVAACNNEETAPATPLLSQSQADSIAEQVAFDVEDENTGATMTGDAGLGAAASFTGLGPLALLRCTPTRTPASPTDTDSDGVPDSVRIDFTGCDFSWPFETDTVRGTIDVLDPTPSVADHSVKRIFTDVARVRVFTLFNKVTSETRNGTRLTHRDATTLQNAETNFRTDFVFWNKGTAAHVKTWNSTFTADVAGAIQPQQPLPSGTWSIDGTSTWTRGANTYSLMVSTSPALHFNASCTVAPRFDAGTLKTVVTRGGRTTTLSIAFTACGVFTATRS